VEAFAELCLVVLGNISFTVELVDTMCEGAGILEGTEPGELPVLAQFCLILGSEILLDNWTRSLVVLAARVKEGFIAIVFLAVKRLGLRNKIAPELLSLTLLSGAFLILISLIRLVVSTCKV
jgi:hypothetical protein